MGDRLHLVFDMVVAVVPGRVGAAVDRQGATAVDVEVAGVEVLVAPEVVADPKAGKHRVLAPVAAHRQQPDPLEEVMWG